MYRLFASEIDSEMLLDDEFWMRQALDAARAAARAGEVPVGACVVDAAVGSNVATAFNQTIALSDPTAHAEVLALRQAGSVLGNYRLTGLTVYTTVEPCAMCAGALVNARVSRLVFGTHDLRFGAVETLFRLCDDERLNHRIEISAGILSEECRSLMQDFFRARRRPASG